MHTMIEAITTKGPRRFVVAGDTGPEAEAHMADLLDRGATLFDASGSPFSASDIDPSSVSAQWGPVTPSAGLVRYATDGRKVE